jgi:hypothetical protein
MGQICTDNSMRAEGQDQVFAVCIHYGFKIVSPDTIEKTFSSPGPRTSRSYFYGFGNLLLPLKPNNLLKINTVIACVA